VPETNLRIKFFDAQQGFIGEMTMAQEIRFEAFIKQAFGVKVE
jgi:hypothetical protein